MRAETTSFKAWAHGLAPDWRRLATRWGAHLLAWALGVGLAWLFALLWWGTAWMEVWRVAQSPAPEPTPPTATAVADVSATSAGQAATPLPSAPEVRERDAAWFWLQQRLQAQGLRLLALRPEPWQNGAVLAQQTAHLRVQGAWADWVALGRALASHATWWTWERWQVQAAGAPGQVQIDARLRLWLRPEEGAAVTARAWPSWAVEPISGTAVPLFAQGDASAQALPASVSASSASGWRLWGVWTQAGESRVVLGRGAEWTVLAPGQRLGPQGDRLDHIGAEGVRLRTPGRSQGVWLPWEGAP